MKQIIFGQLNKEFFEKHQKLLLFVANCWFLKWIIGTNRLPKTLKGKKIDRILPASVSYKTGNSKIKTIYRKGFRPKKVLVQEWTMNAFTRPRFAESLSYKLYPFWKLCHYWDMLFANNLNPAWNLGFDSASYFSGAGDGRTIHDLEYTGGGWNTAHDASDCGTGSLSGAVYNATEESGEATAGCYQYESYSRVIIARAFFPFDTSALPDEATISAATFNVYVNYVEDDDNDGDDWINIVQTTQASNTELVTSDYDQCGAVDNPTEGATRIDLGNITASQYNVWTLNATGIGFISKTGFTKLGLREGHDAIDSPISGSNYWNRIKTRYSEYTGTGSDPYLSVTYTTGSYSPSISPSISQSISPSISPSTSNSISPSLSPSISPSISPSVSPSQSLSPSLSPSISPSTSPSQSISPSISPSLSSSISPSLSPSISQSLSPSLSQSISPSISPSYSPSLSPSISKSLSPSLSQSLSPSLSPSISPSKSPSISPSYSPSLSPSVSPSPSPTEWTWLTKNTASWSNQAKNTSSWAQQSKNTSDWTWVPKRGL